MKLRLFEGRGLDKNEAIEAAEDEMIKYFKANNIRDNDIISFNPMINKELMTYEVTLWTLLR